MTYSIPDFVSRNTTKLVGWRQKLAYYPTMASSINDQEHQEFFPDLEISPHVTQNTKIQT